MARTRRTQTLGQASMPTVAIVAQDKGGDGKSLTAHALAERGRVAGVGTGIVEVDSQGRSLGVLGPDVVTISIDPKVMRRDPSAALRALTPLYAVIETTCKAGGLTVVEFGANEAQRGAMWAAMVDLQDEIEAFGAQCLVLTPFTRQAESMRRGASAAKSFLDAIPKAQLVLIENERDGVVADLHPSSDAASTYRNCIAPLMTQGTTIRMPKIEADSWSPFESAGVRFMDAVMMPVEEVMTLTGLPRPEAKIIRGDVAAWCSVMFREFDKIIAFGDVADG